MRGCHLDRDMEALIAAAGFQLVDLEKYYAPGPRFLTHLHRGTAHPGGQPRGEG